MQPNPYSPPTVDVKIEPLSSWLQEPRPPRPVAVWLTSLVLLIMAGGIFFGSLNFFWIVLSHLSDVSNYGALAFAIVWRVIAIAAAVAVLLGVFRGRKWGRWVGVVALVALAVWTVVGHDTTAYANDAERAGARLGRMIIGPLLMAWWIWAFAFSAKARRFFRVTV